jgi:hypothetical protein
VCEIYANFFEKQLQKSELSLIGLTFGLNGIVNPISRIQLRPPKEHFLLKMINEFISKIESHFTENICEAIFDETDKVLTRINQKLNVRRFVIHPTYLNHHCLEQNILNKLSISLRSLILLQKIILNVISSPKIMFLM